MPPTFKSYRYKVEHLQKGKMFSQRASNKLNNILFYNFFFGILKEDSTLTHIQYVYIDIFVMCLVFLVLVCWSMLYLHYSCEMSLCATMTSRGDIVIAGAITIAFNRRKKFNLKHEGPWSGFTVSS